MRARHLVSSVIAVLVLGGIWLAIAGYYGHGPFASPGVRVGTVISQLQNPDGICAGLGTWNNRAWVDLRLAAPLGNRRVVRDSDGAPLPFEPLIP